MPKLGKGACVVMDNCPIHLGEEVKKAIAKKGAKLIYLSPSSGMAGMAVSVGYFKQLAKDANDRLDRMTKELIYDNRERADIRSK